MKRISIIVLLLILVGCCSSESVRNSTAGSLVKKIKIEWHHTENCRGHLDIVEKITFDLEGHEMWMLRLKNHEGNTIIHSPECPKCKNKETESVVTTETSSDYWGW